MPPSLGGLALGNSANANAATVPTAIRGTWYLKVPTDHLDHTGSYIEVQKNLPHSILLGKLHSKPYIIKGKNLMINSKVHFRFKGGKYHTCIVHVAGQGDIQGLISAHLKIAGKRRHVLLGQPQNGNKFDVYTHFKPTKHYSVTGFLKYR